MPGRLIWRVTDPGVVLVTISAGRRVWSDSPTAAQTEGCRQADHGDGGGQRQSGTGARTEGTWMQG